MQSPLAHMRESVDWVVVAIVLLLLGILLVLTLPLWTPDMFGHLWH